MTINQTTVSEAYNRTREVYAQGHQTVQKLEKLIVSLGGKIHSPVEWGAILEKKELKETKSLLQLASYPPIKALERQYDLALLLAPKTQKKSSSYIDYYDLHTKPQDFSISISTLSDDAELEETLNRCKLVIAKVERQIKIRLQENTGASRLGSEPIQFYKAMIHHSKNPSQPEALAAGTYGEVDMRSIYGMQLACKRCFQDTKMYFNNEVLQLSGLDHPNITPLLEFDGRRYEMYMPLADQNMSYFLVGLIDDPQAASLKIKSALRDVVQGLQYLHATGRVHLDLNSDNILDFSGTMRLADFGGCAYEGHERGIVFAKGYRPPEDFVKLGEECPPATPKKDIFSLGVVIFNILSMDPDDEGYCEMPFAEEPEELIREIDFVYPHRDNCPDLYLHRKLQSYPNQAWQTAIDPDGKLSDLMTQCLHGNPSQRPSAEKILNHPYFQ